MLLPFLKIYPVSLFKSYVLEGFRTGRRPHRVNQEIITVRGLLYICT